MGFAQRIDYPAGTTTLGAGYTSGSGVVTLAITAASFLGGVTPTATNPVRFTLSSASNPATCCHYSCTGSSGSTLTGVTVLKGTDQNFLLGDNVFSSIYAEDFADIQNAGYLTAPVANASLANSSVTISGHAVALGGSVSLAAADVGLGSVTNAAQTLASVVPNTAPAAGQVLVGNAGGTAYAPVAMSGDATLAATGAITVTKTNGTAFAASAKIDTTNAANITSGTLPAARLPNPSATTLGGVQSVAAVSHQWINSISTAGVPSLSQPAFSDLSGTATAAQLPAMVAAGASHAAGIVPDPGVTSHANPYLLGDNASWIQITGSGVSYAAGVYTITGGSGSGTVNSGTAGQVAYYATTGTSVSGESLSSLIDAAIGSTQGDLLYRSATAWSVLAPGTAGQVLQTGGAAANPSWVSGSAQLVFNSSGTMQATDWPAWSVAARVQIASGGGGGGGGYGGATTGNSGGGAGGGGGNLADWTFAKSDLTFPITVNVGVGGTGGTAGPGAGGNGGAGGQGTGTSFGSYLSVVGSNGGGGGLSSGASTGGAPGGNAMYKGGNGGNGSANSNGSNATQPSTNGAGGGGGGGGTAGGASGNGGAGTNWVPGYQGTTGGAGATTAGGTGGNGTGMGLANAATGGAGGGGGGAAGASGVGGAGGNGSDCGGGGGGGAGGYGAGNAGGTGGNGGNGRVVITFM